MEYSDVVLSTEYGIRSTDMEQSLRLVQLTSLNIRSTRRYYYVLRRVVFLRSQTAGMHLSTCPKVLRTQNHDVTKKAHRPTRPGDLATCVSNIQASELLQSPSNPPSSPPSSLPTHVQARLQLLKPLCSFALAYRSIYLSSPERRRAIVLIGRDFINIRPAWSSAAPTSTTTNFWSCTTQSNSPLKSSHFAF
jgi:hypothetical protein